MLYIYTEDLFAINRFKSLIKRALNRQDRGPKAVSDSLVVGLKEFGQSFLLNKNISGPIEAACVLSGVKTLNWAIKQKQKGNIKKIFAGPNLVISPEDNGGILKHHLIDVVVVPSQWVKEYYCQIDPTLESRIKIWPAGVSLPEVELEEKNLDFLVYNKIGNNPLLEKVLNVLTERNFSYKILSYGSFKQQDYFQLLDQAKYEVYLSRSESQGLAMFEAWARGVPTLIWESGQFERKGVVVQGQISAPYLAPQAGLSFLNGEDFGLKLESFVSAAYSSRQYIEENFSNRVCAENYLNLVYGSKGS